MENESQVSRMADHLQTASQLQRLEAQVADLRISTPQAHEYGSINAGDNASFHLGDVHQYYQHLHQSSVASQPTAVIPFRRDRHFIEREVVRTLVDRSHEPAACLALVGLGGVGKTQIAIEYAYRRHEADPRLWVFWVHASNAARFEESFRQIAHQIGIAADSGTSSLSMVCSWLSNKHNGHWAMVVDNADDYDMLFKTDSTDSTSILPDNATQTSTGRSLSSYIPPAQHGSILITTRNRRVAEGFTEYAEDIHDLGPMSLGDASALVLKKLRFSSHDVDQEDVFSFVSELDCFPLAVSQAVAYINQLRGRVSIKDYVRKLQSNHHDQEALLTIETNDPRRQHGSNSVIFTWHASFEHIQASYPSSARLLSLMSTFDRQAIQRELLEHQYGSVETGRDDDASKSSASYSENFDNDLAVLEAYSLVTLSSHEQDCTMHRLVQYSMKRWLEISGELEHWESRCVAILERAVPSDDFASHQKQWQRLLPHVEHLLLDRVQVNNPATKAALLCKAAAFAEYIGRYDAAQKMANDSYTINEALFGVDSLEALESLHRIGTVILALGMYPEAENLLGRVLSEKTRLSGAKHPNTLSAMNNLSAALYYQDKNLAAEALSRRAVRYAEMGLGWDDRLTLRCCEQWSLVLLSLGKLKEAEKIQRQTLAHWRDKYDPSHLDVLFSMGNLAVLLCKQNKNEEAEKMQEEVLRGTEQALGSTHPKTLTEMDYLASMMRMDRRFAAAESLTRHVIQGRSKILGPTHPEVFDSQNSLASVLFLQGKCEEAEQLQRQTVADCERVHGSLHSTTFYSIKCLYRLLQAAGKDGEAREAFGRAYENYVASNGLPATNPPSCQRGRQRFLDMKLGANS